jgi:prolyl-tRNA editing enzyme YbaK/EbsC (Cys-tRNA(Pro) deacylase)
MWPEPVEQIAAFIRSTGAEARIEELPPDTDAPPTPSVHAAAFSCDGAVVVALLPSGRQVDRHKLAAASQCGRLEPSAGVSFPFHSARVFLDQSLLTAALVWLEAGSPRHVLGLAPVQLVRLSRAQTVDVLHA